MRIVFDAKGKAHEYQDGRLVWSRSDLAGPVLDRIRGPMIMPDLPPFRSSIDGSMIDGRVALRKHCERYNVVPTADLAGLPPKPVNNPTFTREYREGTKRAIAEALNHQ